MTSAQVDAYTYGLDVLVFNDGKTLNMSPFMMNKEINFICNIEELHDVIIKTPNSRKISKDYFYKNKNLEKWRTILFDKV